MGDDNFGVERKNTEEIPDAGTPTSFGQSLDNIKEVLPGATGDTNTGDDDSPERLPTDGQVTDDNDNDNDNDNDDSGPVDEDSIIPDAIDAIDDAVAGSEDTPLTINVLGNDDATDVTVTLPNGTSTNGGTVTVNSDGTINYIPPSDFSGTDTFDYTITSANGETDTATVTVTVAPVDDASLLIADTDTTAEDTTLTVLAGSGDGVLDDDSDSDDTLSVSTFTVNGTTVNAGGSTLIAGVGSIQINTDGGYVFTPVLNFNGTVPEITYTTNTGSSSTLNINVTPVNDDAPDAVDDTFATNEDTPISSNVVGSAGGGQDTGVDNGQITPLTNFDTGNGTVTLNADGDFTYTPDTNFFGADTFTYLVTDDEGQTDTATVTINVASVNDAPVNTVPNTQTVNEDTPLVFSAANTNQLSVADADVDLASAVLSVSNGTLVVTAGSGSACSV